MALFPGLLLPRLRRVQPSPGPRTRRANLPNLVADSRASSTCSTRAPRDRDNARENDVRCGHDGRLTQRSSRRSTIDYKLIKDGARKPTVEEQQGPTTLLRLLERPSDSLSAISYGTRASGGTRIQVGGPPTAALVRNGVVRTRDSATARAADADPLFV